jgi:hypothetical protein
VLAEPNITIWRNSLQYTGLSQILDGPNTGVALFIPQDAGLLRADCGILGDCSVQKIEWYASLTDEGVALLMLHWAFSAPNDLLSLAPGTSIRLSSLLTNATDDDWSLQVTSSQSSEGGEITLLLGDSGSRNEPPINVSTTSKVLRQLQSCNDNGALYIIDQPLVYVNAPQASVNSLPALATYCWKSLFSLLKGSPSEMVAYLAIYLATPIFEHFMDPRANSTWFISTSAYYQSQMTPSSKLFLKHPPK